MAKAQDEPMWSLMAQDEPMWSLIAVSGRSQGGAEAAMRRALGRRAPHGPDAGELRLEWERVRVRVLVRVIT